MRLFLCVSLFFYHEGNSRLTVIQGVRTHARTQRPPLFSVEDSRVE